MKILSFFLCILLPQTPLVTLCPDSEGLAPELHLITRSCVGHSCNRSDTPHKEESCTGHDRGHETCGDRSVIDEYLTVDHDLHHIINSAYTIHIADFLDEKSGADDCDLKTSVFPPGLRRTLVLRI